MKPRRIEQNRLLELLQNRDVALDLVHETLDRWLEKLESGSPGIQVPLSSGLRLRLPEMPFHSTPELFLQIQGELEFRFPHESLTLHAGEGIIIPSGLPHAEIWQMDGEAPFLCSIFMFNSQFIHHHFGYKLDEQDDRGRCSPTLRLDSSARNRIIQHLEDIAHYPHEGGPSLPVTRGLLLASLGRLKESLSVRAPDPSQLLAHRCEQLLETHFTRLDLSVQWMAKELGCTPDHLSRVSKKTWGEGILEKIHRLRVDHAKSLLEDLHYQIAEVAWATGFATPSYFNRVFRRQTGLTPSEYRHRLLNS